MLMSQQQSGGSRLQKLLRLIDGGATLETRRAAATQIFKIVATHPSQFPYVLSEVSRHLRHNDWDARVAASHCLGLIADHFVHHTPEDLAAAAASAGTIEVADKVAVKFQEEEELQNQQAKPSVVGSKLASFDVQRVLKQGTPLLASGGEEYELAQSESLSQQRANLKTRMGLGGQMDRFVDTTDFFADEDLTAQLPSTTKNKALQQQPTVGAADLLNDVSGLSARERAAAARKAKAAKRKNGGSGDGGPLPAAKRSKADASLAPGSGGGSIPSSQQTAATDDGGFMSNAEVLEEHWQGVLQGRWAFQDLCDQLCLDVVHPKWEIRHGAALGLREILRSQAGAAGVIAPISGDEPSGWSAAEGSGKLTLGIVTPKDVAAAKEANAAWLEDCALHLLCTLALDRFNDFVSDQVVAPVRETAAQALGVVGRPLAVQDVVELVNALRTLSQCSEWQARHGGLLGLKYVIAARGEIEQGVDAALLPAVISGLQDKDDDVRAVAAEALLPATDLLAAGGSVDARQVLTLLWNALLTLEDLSPATASVVTLIARVYSSPTLSGTGGGNLSTLVPRLWPFLRHNLSTVRRSVVRCLAAILAAQQPEQVLANGELTRCARCLFQNILIDTDDAVVDASKDAWILLIERTPVGALQTAISSDIISAFFQLAGTPADNRLNANLMEKTPALPSDNIGASSGGHSTHPTIFRLGGVGGGDGGERAAAARLNAAVALGLLGHRFSTTGSITGADNSVLKLTLEGMQGSGSAAGRVLAAYTAAHWAQASQTAMQQQQSASGSEAVNQLCTAALQASESFKTAALTELASLVETMRAQASTLITRALQAGIAIAAPNNTPVASLDADGGLKLAAQVPPTSEASIIAAAQALASSATLLQTADSVLRTSVTSALATAVVHSGALPAKLNNLIQPLISAVRREPQLPQQQEAATALALLCLAVVSRSPSPTEKIVKNVCGFASGDPSIVPDVVNPLSLDLTANDGSADGNAEGNGSGPGRKKNVASSSNAALTSAGGSSNMNLNGQGAEDPAAQAKSLSRRGAEITLQVLVQSVNGPLSTSLPQLWTQIANAPITLLQQQHVSNTSTDNTTDAAIVQAAVNSLRILEVVASALHPEAISSIVESMINTITACLGHLNDALKLQSARCLAALAAANPTTVMPHALRVLHTLLSESASDVQRLGGLVAAKELTTRLGMQLVPYVQLVVVPLLRCMSAPEDVSRRLAAQGFATVVSLMPLAQGLPPPPGLDTQQLEMLEREGGFLQQLLDNRKADDYTLPFELHGATLRQYQQEGINWLAFLKRFGLHGVLADDMGLGKTLQATSIIAATLHQQRQKFAASALCDKPLPSLIVCPSTLVAHWPHEIAKFVPSSVLKPLQYSGTPAERTRLRPLLASHDVLVMSYEHLRADIDWVAAQRWSYCVLDEGHVIRNPTSKLAQAAKKAGSMSRHRLLLSGTPVQNSTADLWALFDFLMPGFLGSSKDFNAKFGKAVGASRGAAKDSKEGQAGILALDSLHRQVMPFIMRRTKDQVLKDLPPKTIQDVVCDPGELQKILYEDFQSSQALQSITGLTSAEAPPPHVFQALHYLRRLCSHPILVLDPNVPSHVAAVQRVYGAAAAADWDKVKTKIQNDVSQSPKLFALQELLLECGIGNDTENNNGGGTSGADDVFGGMDGGGGTAGHRVLVFAQTKVMLDLAQSVVLTPMGVTSLRIDGGVDPSERFARVQRFNADPSIDVMLLTTAVGGLGLNLTAADTVVFLEHDWNPAKDAQAMDRAHRLGQKRAVNVYRLLVKGTLEEDIMSLQQFKTEMASAVVNADNASLNAMDTGKLLDLFSGGGGGTEVQQGGKTQQQGGDAGSKSGLQAVLAGLEETLAAAEGQYADEFDLEGFKNKVLGKK